MPVTTRRVVLGQVAGGLSYALSPLRAQAQGAGAAQFPSHTITIVVPFGAGGSPDILARVVAAGLAKAFGKPCIVENRPGANTAIAANAVVRSPPDGHTLMAADISFVVTPHIAANIGINPVKDFKCVGQSAKSVFVLMAASALGVTTLADFIKRTKEQPDAIKIGHTGVGTTPHLAAITFAKATGTNPLLVPYRTVVDAIGNVMAGHISGVFSGAGTAIGPMQEGRLKVLGVTGADRAAIMPDVPTFAENGVEMTGFESGSWYGIVAPAGTPDDIVAKLNGAMGELTRDEEVKAKLAATGIDLVRNTPAQFQAFVEKQYNYWGDTLRAAGVKAETP